MPRKITTLNARRIYKGRLMMGMVLKPLRLFCIHCDCYIPSDMEWVCGHCGHVNTGTRIYSFLNKCQECKRSPKALICPHDQCGRINYLDKSEVASHPARQYPLPAVLPPTLPSTREQIRAEKREKHDERKEDINREIEITGLEKKLKASKGTPEEQSMRGINERWAGYEAKTVGILKKEREVDQSIQQNYPGDSEMRSKVREAFEKFKEDES